MVLPRLRIDCGVFMPHTRYEGIVDTIVQLSYSLTSGLIGAVPHAR
jgi:hypothetical protein